MKKFLILLFILCGLAQIYSLEAQAQNLTLRHSPRLMQGIRPLGMGGAFIAVKGTDENALFYNPAAINDYEPKVHMQFLLPTVEFSYKSISFFASDLLDLIDDIQAEDTDSAKVDVLDQFAAQNTGRYEEIGIRGTVATFMHKYVTASLFYENRSILALLNPASSTVDLEATSHAGLQVGSAYGFFDDKLQVGLALKFLERHLIDETLTQRDVLATGDLSDAIEFSNFGFGIGVDIGAKGKIPLSGRVWEFLDPSFAVTLQDLADTRFFAGDDVGRLEESLTLGAALHPHFWKLESIFAVDVRDLDHRTDFLNKFHAGYEITWPEMSKILRSASVRVGVNQGYITAGFGLDFKYFKLNAATYGREIAEFTTQKQSRMFGLQLAAGF